MNVYELVRWSMKVSEGWRSSYRSYSGIITEAVQACNRKWYP